MERGIINAKTPKEVKKGKKGSKGKAIVVAQFIGIGLVACAAVVLGTDRIVKKICKETPEDQQPYDDQRHEEKGRLAKETALFVLRLMGHAQTNDESLIL